MLRRLQTILCNINEKFFFCLFGGGGLKFSYPPSWPSCAGIRACVYLQYLRASLNFFSSSLFLNVSVVYKKCSLPGDKLTRIHIYGRIVFPATQLNYRCGIPPAMKIALREIITYGDIKSI